MKFLLTLLSCILLIGMTSAQTSITGARFPERNERLVVLGVAVVLVGGLGLILNEKRRRADKGL